MALPVSPGLSHCFQQVDLLGSAPAASRAGGPMPPSLRPASQGGSTASSPAGLGLAPHLAWRQGEQGLRQGILGAVGMMRPSALHAHGVPAQAEGASLSHPGGGAVGLVTLRQEQRPRHSGARRSLRHLQVSQACRFPQFIRAASICPVWSGLVWFG